MMAPEEYKSKVKEARSQGTAAKIKVLRELETLNLQLPAVSIRVLRNYSLETIDPYLKLEGIGAGIDLKISYNDFDTFDQEVINETSLTYSQKPDFILLSLNLENLLRKSRADVSATELFSSLKSKLEILRQRSPAKIIMTSFLVPSFTLHGVVLGKDTPTQERLAYELNGLLFQYITSQNGFFLIHLEHLAGSVGFQKAFDERFWHLYNAPFTPVMQTALSAVVSRIGASVKNPPKKVLVLDCDNTLWGGIVGEDGPNGIKLHTTDAPGSFFNTFQRQIKSLKDRGVVLALCSKNNEGDVVEIFKSHPHCFLKLEDFASHRINWTNKAANIQSLAKELNLGLDSFVFIDDSPTECGFVKAALPQVEVLQTPESPGAIIQILRSYTGFDNFAVTSEDRTRTQMYSENRQRDLEKDKFQSLDEYLKSLELVVDIRSADDSSIARVAQLTQKTNQFNLTTIRRSETEIKELADNPDAFVLTMNVRDRFGDYGLTGVAIVTFKDAVAFIDTFLMSCRVLGRGVETALLATVVDAALKRPNVVQVCGEFRPTSKNMQVENFYTSQGFALGNEMPSNVKRFALSKDVHGILTPQHLNITITI